MNVVQLNQLKFEVDTEHHVVYISLRQNKVTKTTRLTDTIIVDYDEDGSIVGIEILDDGAERRIHGSEKST